MFSVLFGGSANAFVFIIDETNDVIKGRVDYNVYFDLTITATRTVQLKPVVPSI